MRTTRMARLAGRTVAVAVSAATLAGSGSWAYAAEAGVERTGTWLALGVALAVALAAGVAAVAEPRGQAASGAGAARPGAPARAATAARAATGPASPTSPGARYAAERPARMPLVPPAAPPVAPPVWSRPPAPSGPSQAFVEEETPTASRQYFTDDDTMIQRALADQVKARRARIEHRLPDQQDWPDQR